MSLVAANMLGFGVKVSKCSQKQASLQTEWSNNGQHPFFHCSSQEQAITPPLKMGIF